MSRKVKYIGVESRVQYEVLEAALYDYLSNGKLDKEKCLYHIKQFTKGENRSDKILKHISVIFTKNKAILNKISKHIQTIGYSDLSIADRKTLILCLFCLTFPITHDILVGFARAFKVQSIVSKEAILHKIGSAYGSNRAMHIAITEVIPLLIECGILERVKVGIYKLGKELTVTNKTIYELVIYTDICLSNSKTILIDDVDQKPWYSYFNLSNLESINYSVFLQRKDSAVGKGYISINN